MGDDTTFRGMGPLLDQFPCRTAKMHCFALFSWSRTVRTAGSGSVRGVGRGGDHLQMGGWDHLLTWIWDPPTPS